MKKLLLFSTVGLLLSACAGDNISDWKKLDTATLSFEVARGTCKSESYQAVPVPTSSNNCGTNIFVSNAGVHSQNGFSSGFCQGANARQNTEISAARNEIFVGCMYKNGWIKNGN
jgi:hypothetical protein